jgi:hypothetical protein
MKVVVFPKFGGLCIEEENEGEDADTPDVILRIDFVFKGLGRCVINGSIGLHLLIGLIDGE